MNTRKEIALKSIEEAEQRIKDAQRQIELAKKDIEAIDSNPKRFKPKYGEEYFYLNSFEDTAKTNWDGYLVDKSSYITGNMFETEEQAQANKEKYLRKLEILEAYEDNRSEYDLEGNNWEIGYNHNTEQFHPVKATDIQCTKYYFRYATAQNLIYKFDKDLKLIFE